MGCMATSLPTPTRRTAVVNTTFLRPASLGGGSGTPSLYLNLDLNLNLDLDLNLSKPEPIHSLD